MEDELEARGVFRWYSDRGGGSDPRRKRKGEPHAFGIVPLELTPAQWVAFRRAFPDLKSLPPKLLRLPRRVRVAGEADKVGSLAQADLWHQAEVGIFASTVRVRV